ncbi:hypothetical protein, variant 1 [Aphanomyces invadans]|uniref:Uncharacterized protein n=1 Tax=Aphanomyces invadans TaxID=157072 RepID=A0A024TBQ2_9STRA|nr:hypothetical protein, variant 1 [Aphanomyces invadans]ETV90782.1 hypothetical protein, variant 1 [Aphanomyces invadans]|eukprot:XP_008880539.1 hypothetical protein, variant 1 [Aphanomyces invadans]
MASDPTSEVGMTMDQAKKVEDVAENNVQASLLDERTSRDSTVEAAVDVVADTYKHLMESEEYREIFKATCEAQGQDVDVSLNLLDDMMPEVIAMSKALMQSALEDERLSKPEGTTATRLDIRNWTPLLYATYGGKLDEVKAVVANLGDAVIQTAVESNGLTPLHLASMYGYMDIVRFFVQHGASHDAVTVDGATPLFLSSMNGHLDVIQYLVALGAVDGINRPINDGCTALIVAANRGYDAIVTFLVENGASSLATTNDGQTALHAASVNGHIGVVKYLLGIHTYTSYASTGCAVSPFYLAAQNGHLEVVELLVQVHHAPLTTGGTLTELAVAAMHGHVETVRFLIQAGASVEAALQSSDEYDGSTPLFLAIHGGSATCTNARSLEVAELLLTLGGANLEAKQTNGDTVLHFAVRSERLDAVRLLLGKGANANSPDATGTEPLFTAAQAGKWTIVNALLAHGANVDAATADGTTALMVAAEKGDILTVKALLAKDASAALKNKAGRTARDVAVANNHNDVVTAIDDNYVLGPKLYQAVFRNDIDAVRSLLDRGADPMYKTVAGKTPIDCGRSNPDMLALLEQYIETNKTVEAAKPRRAKGDGKVLCRAARVRRHMVGSAKFRRRAWKVPDSGCRMVASLCQCSRTA